MSEGQCWSKARLKAACYIKQGSYLGDPHQIVQHRVLSSLTVFVMYSAYRHHFVICLTLDIGGHDPDRFTNVNSTKFR